MLSKCVISTFEGNSDMFRWDVCSVRLPVQGMTHTGMQNERTDDWEGKLKEKARDRCGGIPSVGPPLLLLYQYCTCILYY
jgi:hypothetical protein